MDSLSNCVSSCLDTKVSKKILHGKIESELNIAEHLKGYTSKYLREKFPELKKKCGKDQLWTQAYYVGTAGSVSQEIIRRYIHESQGK